MWWLRDNRHLFSQFRRPEVQNQGDNGVATPSEGLGGESVLASSTFWWLPAFLDLWPHLPQPAFRCCLFPVLSLNLLLPLLDRVPVMTFRAHPIIQDNKLLLLRSLIWYQLLPCKVLFNFLLYKVIFTVESFF